VQSLETLTPNPDTETSMGRKLDRTRDYGASQVLDGPTTYLQDDIVFDSNGEELIPLVPHNEQPEQAKRKVLPKAPTDEATQTLTEIEKQLGLG
jgi:hypothetical protein